MLFYSPSSVFCVDFTPKSAEGHVGAAMCGTQVCVYPYRDSLLENLVNVTCAQEFRPWEVSDLTSRVEIDNALAQQCPQIG